MKISSLALFCGSSEGVNPLYGETAAQLGAMCADKGLTLYYGGACLGLMDKAAQAALAHHGRVVGIAPSFFSKNVVLAKDISEMIMVNSMSERKQMMEKLADAFVVLPGAYGTMDEFFELITDAQLGMHHKPVAVLNVNGYYDHLIAQLDRFRQDGFLREFHHQLLVVAENLEELFQKLEAYENSNDPQWLDKIKEK